MDAVLTSGTEDTDVQEDTVDPDAPYGRRPDGTAYKRDPEQMRRIREARGGAGGRRRPSPAGPAPARPSRAPTAGKPAAKKQQVRYGAGIAKAIVNGSNLLLSDPVEQAIMRHQGAQLAAILDRVLDEDPRLLQWVERIRTRFAGGAKGELAAWAAGTGGLLAVQRGYRHPLLVLVFGSVLEQCKADALVHQQQQAEARAEYAAMMEQVAEEERRIMAEYAAAAPAPEPARPSPFSSFAEARGP